MSRSFKIFLVFLLAVFVYNMLLPPLPGGSRSHPMAAKTDIANIRTAITMFQQDCGRYPTIAEGLGALIMRPAAIPEHLWHGPYLAVDKLPKNPWGKPYVYECPGKHNSASYDVYSLGRSGKGGNEDIGNWTPAESP
jgi:general secretion pathway protein G